MFDNGDLRRGREARHREEAALCRSAAERATSGDHRDAFLKLALEWERLADEVSGQVKVSRRV
jgi:hypothetical protein